MHIQPFWHQQWARCCYFTNCIFDLPRTDFFLEFTAKPSSMVIWTLMLRSSNSSEQVLQPEIDNKLDYRVFLIRKSGNIPTSNDEFLRIKQVNNVRNWMHIFNMQVSGDRYDPHLAHSVPSLLHVHDWWLRWIWTVSFLILTVRIPTTWDWVSRA